VSDAALLRELYPRVLAKTLAFTRSVPDAEDAVQDAIERALQTWPKNGKPASPEAWLLTAAANCHRDRLRRSRVAERNEGALDALAAMSPWARAALADFDVARAWKDDLLRLLFASCHPALEVGEAAALALTTVIGFSTAEVARAFLVAPRTIEQRLTRARSRLRALGGYEEPSMTDTPERLDGVLCALHLLFNEGYWSTADESSAIRSDLCRLAIGLARSLHSALCAQPEVAALLALFQLHDARRPARMSAEGVPIPLPEQDRARWDRVAIAEATGLLERALAVGRPGPFQIEAAISAAHCRAQTAGDTDWREIAALYLLLERHRPTPAVRVNRAFAVSRADGAAAGLVLLDDPSVDTSGYDYVHLVRATLLAELGRSADARQGFARALNVARNHHEREHIRARMEKVR
jgi:RNA polymerase sigma-70 factor (ECF subfamily)